MFNEYSRDNNVEYSKMEEGFYSGVGKSFTNFEIITTSRWKK